MLVTHASQHWSHAGQVGWNNSAKKTACQSDMQLQRYKLLKSVTTGRAGPGRVAHIHIFIIRHVKDELSASRSLVIRHFIRYSLYISLVAHLFTMHISVTCIIDAGVRHSKVTEVY